jgi:hypothetical protein
VVSRRLVLASLVGVPITKIPAPSAISRRKSWGLLSEDHALSQDSQTGYARLLEAENIDYFPDISFARPDIIIATAAQTLSREYAYQLARLVHEGCHLIYESGLGYAGSQQRSDQSELLNTMLGIRALTSPVLASSELYVTYQWPHKTLLRSYGSVTPVLCHQLEVIMHHGGTAVGLFRRVGQGILIFLGSPLGLGLYAEEREARAIGVSLLKALAAARG